MSLFAGLDISVKTTAILEANGRVLLETMVDSAPDVIASRLRELDQPFERIGLEAGHCRNGFMLASSMSVLQRSVSRPGICKLLCRPRSAFGGSGGSTNSVRKAASHAAGSGASRSGLPPPDVRARRRSDRRAYIPNMH